MQSEVLLDQCLHLAKWCIVYIKPKTCMTVDVVGWFKQCYIYIAKRNQYFSYLFNTTILSEKYKRTIIQSTYMRRQSLLFYSTNIQTNKLRIKQQKTLKTNADERTNYILNTNAILSYYDPHINITSVCPSWFPCLLDSSLRGILWPYGGRTLRSRT